MFWMISLYLLSVEWWPLRRDYFSYGIYFTYPLHLTFNLLLCQHVFCITCCLTPAIWPLIFTYIKSFFFKKNTYIFIFHVVKSSLKETKEGRKQGHHFDITRISIKKCNLYESWIKSLRLEAHRLARLHKDIIAVIKYFMSCTKLYKNLLASSLFYTSHM